VKKTAVATLLQSKSTWSQCFGIANLQHTNLNWTPVYEKRLDLRISRRTLGLLRSAISSTSTNQLFLERAVDLVP